MDTILAYHCLKQRSEMESGAAALCTIAQHYNLKVTPSGLSRLTGLTDLTDDLGQLIVLAKLLGFEAIPLEGEYDQLPEVPMPTIVMFDNRFVVLYAIDEQEAKIGNTATGSVETISRQTFVQQWTGDVLYIEPEEAKLATVQEQLQDLSNPWQQLRRATGFTPPYYRMALFAVALLGIILWVGAYFTGAFGHSPASHLERLLIVVLSLALSASVWGTIFDDSCPSCSQAASLVGGLPLTSLGAGFYAGLLFIATFFEWRDVFAASLFFAIGTHLYLLNILRKWRLSCPICLVTATSAIICGLLLLGLSPISLLPWLFAAALGGAIAAWKMVKTANQITHWRSGYEIQKLAQSITAEERADEKVRLVVYKRPKCSHCLIYEAVIRPALEQTFGQTIIIDEREAREHKIPVPFMVVNGTMNLALVRPDFEQLHEALQAASNPNFAAVGTLGGIQLLGGW